MSNDGSAIIRKYQKRQEKIEEGDKSATQNMKKIIAAAMRDTDTHRNIAKELLDARRCGHTVKHREGFSAEGEEETGYERPWERD